MKNPIVSREEWTEARKQLLVEEKEHHQRRAELARKRRELPWVRIEKPYVFDGPDGRVTLADLFAGRSQLHVQHFMFGPSWKEGCPGCSFQADHHDAALLHLAHRDMSLVAVSRAPIAAITAFKQRMGWKFPWVSSFGNDFNFDFHVSFEKGAGTVYYNYEQQSSQSEELPGTSVFYKSEAGEIFHTYSAYGGGDEIIVGALNYLDFLPKGREADGEETPWLRHHDRY